LKYPEGTILKNGWSEITIRLVMEPFYFAINNESGFATVHSEKELEYLGYEPIGEEDE